MLPVVVHHSKGRHLSGGADGSIARRFHRRVTMMRKRVPASAQMYMGISVCLAVFLALIFSVRLAGSEAAAADAAKNKDARALISLLEQHVDVNAPQADGTTALHWAANWDDVRIANILIGAGANVNAKDESGITPLALACSKGNA